MKQRLIRVLVYEGTPEWIANCLEKRGVKGSYSPNIGCIIKEAVVGDFLESFEESSAENKNEQAKK